MVLVDHLNGGYDVKEVSFERNSHPESLPPHFPQPAGRDIHQWEVGNLLLVASAKQGAKILSLSITCLSPLLSLEPLPKVCRAQKETQIKRVNFELSVSLESNLTTMADFNSLAGSVLGLVLVAGNILLTVHSLVSFATFVSGQNVGRNVNVLGWRNLDVLWTDSKWIGLNLIMLEFSLLFK